MNGKNYLPDLRFNDPSLTRHASNYFFATYYDHPRFRKAWSLDSKGKIKEYEEDIFKAVTPLGLVIAFYWTWDEEYFQYIDFFIEKGVSTDENIAKYGYIFLFEGSDWKENNLEGINLKKFIETRVARKASTEEVIFTL